MYKHLCFDIETRGTTNQDVIRMIREEEERKPCPGKPTADNPRKETVARYKEAVEKWDQGLEQRVQDRIDNTAKDPLLAEPVCISAVVDNDVVTFDCLEKITEKEMIQDFMDFIVQTCDDQVLFSGYCIKIFDLPVLITRSRINRIMVPSIFPRLTGRYWSMNVADIKDLIFCNRPFLSFCEAATAYGIDAKKIEWMDSPMIGSRVQDALRAGEHDLIRRYCAADAENEWDLLNMCLFNYDQEGTVIDRISEVISSDLPDSQKIITIKNLI